MSDRRAVTIGLVPAAAAGMGRAQKRRRPIAITRMLGYGLAVAGLAMAQPAQALITLTASDAGGPIGACSSTDGGTGSLNKNCANPNFTAIIVNAVGAPLVPAPNLVATQLSVTSAALATSDTLTIDVAQTGISFPAGVASVNLTVAGLGPSPVTLTALGSGGGVLFSHTFTAVGTATSGDIPVGPGTGEGARFVLAFSGPGQSVNAIISIGGPIPATTSRRDPGSVIVYPKFVNELFDGGSPLVVDGVQVPQTEIEIGAICPPAFVDAGGFCPEHQPLKLRFHWVCPGAEGTNSNICPEVDFDVNLTVPGKLTFAANGLPINTNSPPRVPAPPCARGYLIGWVISPTNDLPIKFDGLVGNAIIRNPNLVAGPHAGSSTGLSAYTPITIAADPTLANLAPIADQPGPLLFDGTLGHYTQIAGVQIGDVRFDKTTPGAPMPNVLGRTNLNFLTLNVLSNRPNNPTFVNLDFWNESLGSAVGSTNPAFEHRTSSFTEFVCWTQVPLSALAGGSLTQAFQGTRKGVVIAGPATKIADGNAPADHPGPVTLLGLVETIEGTAANGFLERKYNFNMNSNGVPVAAAFVP